MQGLFNNDELLSSNWTVIHHIVRTGCYVWHHLATCCLTSHHCQALPQAVKKQQPRTLFAPNKHVIPQTSKWDQFSKVDHGVGLPQLCPFCAYASYHINM